MTNWTDGELMGFDLETTGKYPHTALPVSYAFVHFRPGAEPLVISGLVNPGVPIPPEATAIHGITDEMVADALPLEAAASYCAGLIAGNAAARRPLVGMNIAYDLTVVRNCVERVEDLTVGGFVTPSIVLDLVILDKEVDKYRRGKRTLTDLALLYGAELGDDAHDAAADVVATVGCVLALAELHPSIANMELRTLHERQARWHREQKGSLSDYFVRNGDEPIPAWQFDWPVYGREEVPA